MKKVEQYFTLGKFSLYSKLISETKLMKILNYKFIKQKRKKSYNKCLGEFFAECKCQFALTFHTIHYRTLTIV